MLHFYHASSQVPRSACLRHSSLKVRSLIPTSPHHNDRADQSPFHPFHTGKFSNNSTTQLSLLNSTVAQLAKSVNQVLTKTYNMLYGDDDAEGEEPAQLRLQTSPLASSDEVQKLFAAQIIDLESALPVALHALGATTDEVKSALERGLERQKKQLAMEEEERSLRLKRETSVATESKSAADVTNPSANENSASSEKSEKSEASGSEAGK